MGNRVIGMSAIDNTAYRALVTGGGGFIGRAIVERLLGRGCAVRVLARGEYPDLAAAGVEVVRGDLTDDDAVIGACRDCDVVYHVAAKAGVWGKMADYHGPNVAGTRNVIAGCRRHDVGRLIFTSSPSVVFDGGNMEGVDENKPYPSAYRSPYSATKAEAERSVLAVNCGSLRTLALRPHLVWGPRDNHIVPRILAQGRAGKLRIVGPGDNKVDTTYIDNAAEAHVLAADALATNPSAAGRAYFISQGEPIAIREIINAILHAGGVAPVTRHVSRRTAIMAGVVLEGVYSLFRLHGEPRMTRFLAEELASSHWFDISAARNELGYKPRISIGEGLDRLEAWLNEESRQHSPPVRAKK